MGKQQGGKWRLTLQKPQSSLSLLAEKKQSCKSKEGGSEEGRGEGKV